MGNIYVVEYDNGSSYAEDASHYIAWVGTSQNRALMAAGSALAENARDGGYRFATVTVWNNGVEGEHYYVTPDGHIYNCLQCEDTKVIQTAWDKLTVPCYCTRPKEK